MEDLYFNLSEEEFSTGRKILLWIFAGLFFMAGTIVLMQSLVFGHKSIHPIVSVAPYSISLIVTFIATLATLKRKDLFFKVDGNQIEYRYGLINPKKKSYLWNNIKEIVLPQKQKKAKLIFHDGSSFTIDLTWLQKKKSALIRKHIYYSAKQKNIPIIRVSHIK